MFYISRAIYLNMRPYYIFLLVTSFVYIFIPELNANTKYIANNFAIEATRLNELPVAVNDTFELLVDCGNNSIKGDILANDYDPDGDAIKLSFVKSPGYGTFKINSQGSFNFTVPDDFTGILVFKYRISETTNTDNFADAEFVIFVRHDHDCDGVSDFSDMDNDNDGILDINEGNGDVDYDKDGVTNNLDIDSDNDGITDNEEWQKEGNYVAPLFVDENKNGWDDAYDTELNGTYYQQVDTDKDGTPDFMDFDSDNDSIPDSIEGYDKDNDGIPELKLVNLDTDNDGLDDAYDSITGWLLQSNSTGSYAILADFDKNGIRDWRESANTKPVGGENNFISQQIEQSYSAIYPNPSRGTFKFLIAEELINQGAKMMVTDFSGKTLFYLDKLESTNLVNVPNIEAGTYLLKVYTDTQSSTKKLIIIK